MIKEISKLIDLRKGCDDLIMEAFLHFASDAFGEEHLRIQGMNFVVMNLITSSLSKDKRLKYWSDERSKENKCLLYLIKMCQYPNTAAQLNESGAITVLSKLFSMQKKIAFEAALAVIFIGLNTDSEYGTFFKFSSLLIRHLCEYIFFRIF